MVCRVGLRDISAACGVSAITIRAHWIKRPEWPLGDKAGRSHALSWEPDELPEILDLKRGSIVVRGRVLNWMLRNGHMDDAIEAVRPATELVGKPEFSYSREDLWRWIETRTQRLRDQGLARAKLLFSVMALHRSGQTLDAAFDAVGIAEEIPSSTLRRWYYGTARKPGAKLYAESDWMAALVPTWAGRSPGAECSEEAWDVFKAFYLSRRSPTLAICYERTQEIAREKGWMWPPQRTIYRRVKNTISVQVITLAREGTEALDKMMPSMRRDRSGFHAMEAVNGDGIDWKRYCIWPDGEVGKPCTWITQDLNSNKLLAWRTDKSENKHMFRLAYGDLVERWGIPAMYFIDNTMAAASKWMTGGVKNRYRWKIRDDDPLGIMPQMGTTVRFVKPGHGQSKPIERANQELRQRVDTHPKFEGRGTKARPIPITEFIAVMEAEFKAYNAKPGRRTQVASGRSFDEVFKTSYESHPIKKATAEQRRLWLCVAEKVRASRDDGSVVLGRGPHGENRYWCEALAAHCGQMLVVRFDPQNLHKPVYCYALNGGYIGQADCRWAAGFDDSVTAHEYQRARGQRKRLARQGLDAERRLSALSAAKSLPAVVHPDDPESKVVSICPLKAVNDGITNTPSDDHDPERIAQFDSAVSALRAHALKDKL